MKKQIGLFFGSFNPIHIGHLMIADSVAQTQLVQEVWFVVSPQNPFKQKKSLLNQYDRLHLVKLAIADNPMFRASSIEFKLPVPSYTIDTLTHLQAQRPDVHFSLIMGGDNLTHFHKWKNYEQILKYYHIIVYPRPNAPVSPFLQHPKVTQLTVPIMDISASYIRKAIQNNQAYRYFLHPAVHAYIQEMHWYANV